MSWRYGAGGLHVFARACCAAVIVGEIWWLATTQSRCRSITDCYAARRSRKSMLVARSDTFLALMPARQKGLPFSVKQGLNLCYRP